MRILTRSFSWAATTLRCSIVGLDPTFGTGGRVMATIDVQRAKGAVYRVGRGYCGGG